MRNMPCLGLGGDSGGPEGEKAGALEFKELRVKGFSQAHLR
jgi:hypothetical protein